MKKIGTLVIFSLIGLVMVYGFPLCFEGTNGITAFRGRNRFAMALKELLFRALALNPGDKERQASLRKRVIEEAGKIYKV